MSDDLITSWRYRDPPEALIAHGKLKAEGFDCFLDEKISCARRGLCNLPPRRGAGSFVDWFSVNDLQKPLGTVKTAGASGKVSTSKL